MFNKIAEKISKAIENAKQAHEQRMQELATRFNDDIAKKTSWEPLKSGGANFKTHNLLKQSSNVIKYTMSIGAKIFLAIFAVVGIGGLVAAMYIIFIKGDSNGWIFLLFGSIFSLVSFFMYKTIGKPIILDRTMGFVYKGFKPPKFSGMQAENTEMTYFNDVHAIQIIKEYIRSNKSRYYSYELNLVLKDATRVNIIDHGNYPQISKDAEEISKFIGKPVWDAVK